MTKFLALSKVLPGNEFLQILDIPTATATEGQPKLCYDPEWLEIVHRCACLFPLGTGTFSMPSPFSYPPVSDEKIKEITDKLKEKIAVKESLTGAKPEPTTQQAGHFQEILQEGCGEFTQFQQGAAEATAPASANPEEIDLDN